MRSIKCKEKFLGNSSLALLFQAGGNPHYSLMDTKPLNPMLILGSVIVFKK